MNQKRLSVFVAVCSIAWSAVRIVDSVATQLIKECREPSSLPLILWPSRPCIQLTINNNDVTVPELLHWQIAWLAIVAAALLCGGLFVKRIEKIGLVWGAILAGSVYWFAVHDFGGFDFAIIVDSAYRVLQGQVPYRDIFYSLPVAFVYPAAGAFWLFGVKWYALAILAGAFAGATFFWLRWLLVRLNCETPILGAVAIEACTMASLGFWWYNNVTSVLAACFILSCFLWRHQPVASLGTRISFVASMAALALAKPNTAAPCLAAGFLFVFWRDREVLIEAGVAAVLALGALKLCGIPAGAMIGDYLIISTARADSDPWIGWRINGLTDSIRGMIVPVVLLAAIVASRRAARGAQFLIVACIPITALAMTTNGEMKEVDTALIAVAALMCGGEGWGRRLRIAGLCGLIAGSFYMGATRYRVATIGEHRFHEWDQEMERVPYPFFDAAWASPTLTRTYRQAQMASRGKVYYGSRLEWMYAATGRPSPRGLPVWWNPAAAFPEVLTEHFEQTWEEHRFDTLIFCRWDAPFYDQEFGRVILDSYTVDTRYSELTVFRRKKPQWTAGH